MTAAATATDGRIPEFDLGERIRKVREDLGATQQEFADQLMIHRRTVVGWESGVRKPRYRDIKAIADMAGVSLQWLAGETYRRLTAHDGGVPHVESPRSVNPATFMEASRAIREYGQPA
jgi:transcriptional regulator with XRE-family HTH domain